MSLDMDMKEIHGIFFEESAEGLDAMESGLLGLSPGSADPETINTIFRAAHSIKGGAATFGFLTISNFTHGVETLLDQLRSGQREIDESLVELFLESVDCLRSMLEDLQAEREPDASITTDVQARIDALLSGDTAQQTPVATSQTDQKTASGSGWRIVFEPDPGVLKTGNEPARIFRELEQLGKLSVSAELSSEVSFDTLDPESCYCKWTLELDSAAPREAVEEAFDWVKGQCHLEISAIQPEAEAEKFAPAAVASSNEPKPASTESSAPAASASKDAGSIRVSIDKIDALLNLVGELVITQSMLARYGEGDGNQADVQGLRDGLLVLERHTRELQESAMQIRMLPIGTSFSRFKRLVRDISGKLGKKVELKLSGENTELDKTVLEKMSDPLVHLVRNSLDHGIESPEKRLEAGKSETGTLHLSAYHEGGNIVIQVKDDGAGLNKERILSKAIERGIVSPTESLSDDQINNLIFQPGFSTAEQVSDMSGRGVGMDVVRRNIIDLGGRIDVQSKPGEGSTFKIRLPLTLAILDGQLVRVGKDVYIFSLLSIVETVLVSGQEVSKLVGNGRVYRLRDEYIPVISLREAFGLRGPKIMTRYGEREGELLVVVETDGTKVGLFVDELMDQQQVVIKSLEENYLPVTGLSGATILGDGSVAMIIDVPSLVHSIDFKNIDSDTETGAA
ncbi:chemotaxis protein CheA [Spongiibacter nanhainus]|uniref:Chemotaxis protein CheA n=1 Tax=Spongiibacter nanhainus TaxID=2794344 RepID=A0A7T4R015_9GAMM|nr:chemotaxis protein CheA [Spongiibacter nanhainus]QQD17794.1 chemotaxis protein CheA [Spongiibacter nanhainus]